MNKNTLAGEMQVEMQKLHHAGTLEINLQLTCLPDKRVFHELPKRIILLDDNSQKKANVRVDSIIVNVKTRPI